jgi:hypothetical protein
VRTSVLATATLRTALGELVAVGEQYAPVVDEAGRPIAIVTTSLVPQGLERPLNAPADFAANQVTDLRQARPA